MSYAHDRPAHTASAQILHIKFLYREEQHSEVKGMEAVIDVDGKKAIVNTGTDETILEVGDGVETDEWFDTRGTDLMVHVTKNGTTVYYLYHWTRWQGERDRIEAATKEQALNWLAENYHFATESALATAAKYGLEVHETA